MRRTLLASAAALTILAGPALAQGQGGGAPRRDAGEDAAPRGAQERGRPERAAPAAERDQRPSPERREARDDPEPGQPQRAQSRPEAPERRGTEQREERSGPAGGDQTRPGGTRTEQPSSRAGEAQPRGTEGRTAPARDTATQPAAREPSRPAAGTQETPARAASPAQPTNPAPAGGGAAPSGTDPASRAAAPAAAPAPAPATTTPPAGAAATPTPAAPASPTPATAPAAPQAAPGVQDTRVEITPERRERITDIITRESRETRTRIDFSVSVGTVVPTHVRLRQLPTEIVEIAPRYRGHEFFVAEDEIVIVEPGSNRIVTTLSRNGQFAQGGGGAAGGAGGGFGGSMGGRAGSGNAQMTSGGQGQSGDLCRINDAGRGGSGGNSGLAVAVRSQDGRATDMISLPSGRITVEVDPSGACTITVER